VVPFSMAVKEQDKTATTKNAVRDVVEPVFEQGTPFACRIIIFLGLWRRGVGRPRGGFTSVVPLVKHCYAE
jgi:hypothetical protein